MNKAKEKTETKTNGKSNTTLEKWKKFKREPENVTLPSGACVKLRRVTLLEEASQGHISMSLVNTSMEYAEKAKNSNLSKDDMTKLIDLANKITVLATIDPIITDEDVDNIPFEDRMFIFTYINTVPGSESLEPFRKG